ncbi:hypothetical protein [Variovorax sp. efr-133-TYG-130]|uniref:hypothetical protein n=1 Tax=Variovorax sp. efr-133-TYG-130 TaxID=3040327 RepID=UPI002553AA8A|nr:hypothetical protein [Variovorax sp. efr-133-TYG-130]
MLDFLNDLLWGKESEDLERLQRGAQAFGSRQRLSAPNKAAMRCEHDLPPLNPNWQ